MNTDIVILSLKDIMDIYGLARSRNAASIFFFSYAKITILIVEGKHNGNALRYNYLSEVIFKRSGSNPHLLKFLNVGVEAWTRSKIKHQV